MKSESVIDTFTREEMADKVTQLLAQGKRNLVCSEVVLAVQQFQEACSILCKQYGEMADECADAYFLYGKSLLELSRLEGGIIGDAVPSEETLNSSAGEDDDEDDTEVFSEETEQDKVESYSESGGKTTDDTKENTGADKQADCVEEEEKQKKEEKDEQKNDEMRPETQKDTKGEMTSSNTSNETPTAVASTSFSAGPSTSSDPQPDEDVSNLQLAWEMLELAKIIYSRHSSRDMKLKLAETFLKLGEIGMETEQFEQSIEDLNKSLSLLKTHLSPEDRGIAETLYQLAVACQLGKRYEEAIRHLEEAVAVLESRVRLLEAIALGTVQPETPVDENKAEGQDPGEATRNEILEINEIIPDIKAKIEDVKDEQSSAAKVRIMMDALNQFSAAAAAAAAASNVGGPSSSQSPFAAAAAAATTTNHCSAAAAAATTTNHFAAAAAAATNPFAAAMNEPMVNNITHLIRKKRKDEKEDNLKPAPMVKRLCTQPVGTGSNTESSGSTSAAVNSEPSTAAAAVNGESATAVAVNGGSATAAAVNGESSTAVAVNGESSAAAGCESSTAAAAGCESSTAAATVVNNDSSIATSSPAS